MDFLKDRNPSPLSPATVRVIARGTLSFGEIEVGCYVVSHFGKRLRVLSKRDVVHVLSGKRHDGKLQRYKVAVENLDKIDGAEGSQKSAVSEKNDQETSEFSMGPSVAFRLPTGRTVHGVEGVEVYRLCKRYVDAMIAGKLHPRQTAVAQRAWKIVGASGEAGIEALIDDATGYTSERPRYELSEKFALLMRDDLAPWERMFPEKLYVEFARLDNHTYEPGVRPPHWGNITAEIYRCFDEDVALALRERNPSPSHGRNHHQLLTPMARKLFAQRLESVVITARQSLSMGDFLGRMGFLFRGKPLQLWLTELPPSA